MELSRIESDKQIRQANAITSGRYDYTACQLDVLFMVIALLEKDDPPSKAYTIHISDIESITGRKWNYQQLQEATKDMGFRVFEITTAKSLKQFCLFQGVEYLTGQGCFNVIISELARPLLFNLKQEYTVLQLKAALSCTSKYAKRLYTIACQWRTTKGTVLGIGELKEMLFLKDPKGKEKEQFIRISDFEKKVLKIAKEQINANTDIQFDYKLLKRGRSFDRVKISVNANPVEQTLLNFQEPINPEITKEQKKKKILTEWGFKGKALEQIAKLDPDLIQQLADEVDKKVKTGEVTKAHGYFIGILKNKGLLTEDIPESGEENRPIKH
jgi:plasmid replication initiation protein